MSKKEIKEYLVIENGKTTNIQPISIGDNRDFLKRSLNPVYQPRENKKNALFEEWFNGPGCGYQECCGKSEKEKLQLAFEAGQKCPR